jgi:hypothetical protein
MKKSLNKPEYWQDFESLCKKLFGEVWECRNTIRKNGRTGQEQCGVDVYGIPKGEDAYFGIQCKGKDVYTGAKLTEREVMNEISKARAFQPALKVFVIATTGNKDVGMEAFVRNEDIKSRLNGGFEIQLYAWEDLVDLIDEHEDVYRWYLTGQQIRGKYECTLLVNGVDKPAIKPVYAQAVTVYVTAAQNEAMENAAMTKMLRAVNKGIFFSYPRERKRQFNYSVCTAKISIQNTGNNVLEDWKLDISFTNTQIKQLLKEYEGESGGYDADFPKILLKSIGQHHIPSLSVDDQTLTLTYKPGDNSPLIQRDSREFSIWLRPLSHEISSIELHWELLARDYNAAGNICIAVKPSFEREWKQVVLPKDQLERDNDSRIFERITDKEPSRTTLD